MANDIFSDIQSYLRQQKELSGDFFISGDELPLNDSPEEEMVRKKKTDVIETERDLILNGNPAEPWESSSDIISLKEQISGCLKCPLGKTRTNFVFGVGNPNADVMFIGEAPGADEDEKGEPFVGRAGQLLNKIMQAIDWKREDVFIANILKCRPPDNRDPLPSEEDKCEPFLVKQIELIKPIMIICLGRIAAQTLLRTKDSLTTLRSKVQSYHGVPLYVTYHPAALLRNPHWKPATWEDFKKIKSDYENNPNKKNKKILN